MNRFFFAPDSSENGLANPGTVLGRWIGSKSPRIGSRDLGEKTFGLKTATASLLPTEVRIVDGLDAHYDLDPDSIYQRSWGEMRTVARSRVVEVQLPHPGATRLRNRALFPETQVMELKPVADAAVRSLRIPVLDAVAVQSLKTLNEVAYVKGEVSECLLRIPGAREATARMRSFPHVRRSLHPTQIHPDIIESFFQEAEALKGLQAENGQFLAFFRNIPVALISRIRFLKESGVLLYTIAPPHGPLTARLHDIAAIAEPAKGIIHLVVHRTRSRAILIQ